MLLYLRGSRKSTCAGHRPVAPRWESLRSCEGQHRGSGRLRRDVDHDLDGIPSRDIPKCKSGLSLSVLNLGPVAPRRHRNLKPLANLREAASVHPPQRNGRRVQRIVRTRRGEPPSIPGPTRWFLQPTTIEENPGKKSLHRLGSSAFFIVRR